MSVGQCITGAGVVVFGLMVIGVALGSVPMLPLGLGLGFLGLLVG